MKTINTSVVEWLTCKNLRNSCKFLQGDASSLEFFFQNFASSYKLIIRIRPGMEPYLYKNTYSTYKLL